MNDIFRDVSPAGLARANELNVQAFKRLIGVEFGGEVVEKPGLTLTVTLIPYPFFNGVADAHLTAASAAQAIAEASAYFAARQSPWAWSIGPSTEPANLSDVLLAAGFAEDDPEPAMGMDLEKLTLFPSPSGLRIERVRTPELLAVWQRTAVEGFGMPSEASAIFARTTPTTNLADDAPMRQYLGWAGDVPVATCLLVLAAGVAGIYTVSTIGRMRGRGIGAAMTVAALREAREMGYRVGILQASAMGYSVYERLGFREHFRYRVFVAPRMPA